MAATLTHGRSRAAEATDDTLRLSVHSLRLLVGITRTLQKTPGETMSQSDGHWADKRDGDRVRGSTIRIGPVFAGEVSYAAFSNGWGWKAALNGQDMGGYPTIEQAKARIDWEVWNRLRQTEDGYKVLMGRREDWKGGNG
jgi:hypothetical protein